MHHRDAATAFFLCLTVGCTSSYLPQPSPRVSLVMEGGSYAYVRDGRKYEGGLFGGDIDKVVQGNPKAEKYAHEYKTGMVTGFILTTIGVVGAAGGLTVLTVDASQSRSPGSSVPPTGLIIAGAGLFVEIVGAILELNAIPHVFDAVNAYNDGPACRRAVTSGYAVTAARRRVAWCPSHVAPTPAVPAAQAKGAARRVQ
jgi:hypothetical protein